MKGFWSADRKSRAGYFTIARSSTMFERLAWNISLLSEIANSRWAIFLCGVSNRRVQILREVVMVSRQALTNILKASRQSPHGYGVASGHWLTAMHLPGGALVRGGLGPLPDRPTSQERNLTNSCSFGVLNDSGS